MSAFFHADVFDNGLSEVVAQNAEATLTWGRPLSRDDATLIPENGGKRVADVQQALSSEMTLESFGDGRVVSFPYLAFITNREIHRSILHVAIYDATRLLVAVPLEGEELISSGQSFEIHNLKVGFK